MMIGDQGRRRAEAENVFRETISINVGNSNGMGRFLQKDHFCTLLIPYELAAVDCRLRFAHKAFPYVGSERPQSPGEQAVQSFPQRAQAFSIAKRTLRWLGGELPELRSELRA